MRPLTAGAKLALIKRSKSGEKVAHLCREAGISRKTFYSWLNKHKSSRPNLVSNALSDKRFKNKTSVTLMHPKDRLLVVNSGLAGDEFVASVCRRFGIFPKTYYRFQ